MARIIAAFGTQAPVCLHQVGICHAYRHVFVKKAGRHVMLQGRRRVHVADKGKDHAFNFPHRVTLYPLASCQGGVRVVQQATYPAVIQVEGKSVVPAGYGIVRITHGTFGETRAAVTAAILYGIQAAGTAQEQDILPQQLDRLVFTVPDVAAGFRRIPVIAEPQFRLEPVAPGFVSGCGVGPLVIEIRHIGCGAPHQVHRNLVELAHTLTPSAVCLTVAKYNIVNLNSHDQ